MGKNNHNPTTTILLAILVVMQVVVSFYFWQGNLKLQRENLVLKELNRQQQHQTEVLAHQLSVQHEAVGKNIPQDLQVRNRAHDIFAFESLLQEGSRLFLFVPPASCSSCTSNIFAALPDILDVLGERITFICTDSDYNTLMEYGDYRIRPERIYSVSRSSFSFLNDLPYFAEISADGCFKMFFCLENNNIGVFLDFIKSNYAIH